MKRNPRNIKFGKGKGRKGNENKIKIKEEKAGKGRREDNFTEDLCASSCNRYYNRVTSFLCTPF